MPHDVDRRSRDSWLSNGRAQPPQHRPHRSRAKDREVLAELEALLEERDRPPDV